MNLTNIEFSDYPIPAEEYYIIQTLLIEFIEIANLNIEIKKYRNCGMFFVPDNIQYSKEFDFFKDNNNK